MGGEALNIILDMGTGISAYRGFVYLYRRCLFESFGYLTQKERNVLTLDMEKCAIGQYLYYSGSTVGNKYN